MKEPHCDWHHSVSRANPLAGQQVAALAANSPGTELAAAFANASARPLPGFNFLFPSLRERPFQPNVQALFELGRLMEAGGSLEHPSLPAGYTYLSQFIAHDISFNRNQGAPEGVLAPEQIEQGRLPSLDLDSLYGNGPEVDRQLYKDDLLHFKLGETTPSLASAAAGRRYPNDLPRQDAETTNPRKAVVADARNDDNLVVAQTQVAFLKFHNAVLDWLADQGVGGAALFATAREQVVRHYQWIILTDLLPRVVKPEVWLETLQQPLRHYQPRGAQELFVPLEFAFAAFRFGHSMIRPFYEWNRFFQSGATSRAARLHELFALTGEHGNMQGTSQTLPSNWLIDWTRFYDFSGHGLGTQPKLNRARKIQASLSQDLRPIARFLGHLPEQYRSLAVLDLLRGNQVGLPAAQDVAAELRVPVLPPAEITRGLSLELSQEFGQRTPLWYYVLKEAELEPDNRLGPVGGRIVAETLIGLLRNSRISILPAQGMPGEGPALAPSDRPAQFSMADLLLFVRNRNQDWDELNPLGN